MASLLSASATPLVPGGGEKRPCDEATANAIASKKPCSTPAVQLPATREQQLVAAGGAHSLAVVTGPRVVAFGWDCRRQIGVGDSDAIVQEDRRAFERAPKPVAVARLDGESPVLTVAAGTNHSACVTADGRLWTWGRAAEGQLGHGPAGSNAVVAVPRRVASLAAQPVAAVAAGMEHSAAITKLGSLFTWGSAGAKGRLGLGPGTPDQFTPQRVVLPGVADTELLVSLACADEATAVVTADGVLFMCGELPTPNGEPRLSWHVASTPETVSIPVDTGRLTQISCGGRHFAGLTSEGALFTWGCVPHYFVRRGKLQTLLC